MLHDYPKRAALGAPIWRRGLILLPGFICLASLTYCGLHSGSSALNQKPSAPNSFPGELPSGDSAVFELAAGSDVVLRGTTSIGSWSSSSSDLQVRLVLFTDRAEVRRLFDEIDTGRLAADHLTLPTSRPPIARLAVPVMSLRGSSAGMDRDLHSALKASEYPKIEYDLGRVKDVEIKRDPSTRDPQLVLHAVGTLSVAGVRRDLATNMTIRRDANRHYLVSAQTEMQMTDFDVKPPTALFGVIRAHNSVAVIFTLEFTGAGGDTTKSSSPEAAAASQNH